MKTLIGKYKENNYLNYLIKKQKEYEKIKFDTPVLNHLIENKKKLKTKYFRKERDEEYFIDHLYDYLKSLLLFLNLDLIDFQDKKIGYICYFDIEKINFTKEYILI